MSRHPHDILVPAIGHRQELAVVTGYPDDGFGLFRIRHFGNTAARDMLRETGHVGRTETVTLEREGNFAYLAFCPLHEKDSVIHAHWRYFCRAVRGLTF